MRGDPGDCRNQMQKTDGEIAHGAMLPRSRYAQEMPRIVNSCNTTIPLAALAVFAQVCGFGTIDSIIEGMTPPDVRPIRKGGT